MHRHASRCPFYGFPRLRLRGVGLLSQALIVACHAQDVRGARCSLYTGDLVLSEIMVAPAVDDAEQSPNEWFEVYNATDHAVQLNRLVLSVDGLRHQDHEVQNAPALASQAYFVFGQTRSPLGPPDYAYGNDLTLADAGAVVALRCGDTLVDEVTYGATGGGVAVEPGVSLAFDGGIAPDALANDNGDYWCPSLDLYDDLNRGSPGTENSVCGGAVCQEQGGTRPVVSSLPGDLVITEVFAKSALTITEFGSRDWLEVYNARSAAIDLNGLKIVVQSVESGALAETMVVSPDCIVLSPHQFAVIGAAVDPAWETAAVLGVVASDLRLFNEASLAIDIGVNSAAVDHAEVAAAVSGRSWALFPESLTASANDNSNAFCVSEATFTFSERGTPGRPNLCGILCVDEGVQRQSRLPSLGDVLITEVFPNPSGADQGRDWIELYVARDVDLNGLSIELTSPGGTSGSWTLSADANAPCVGVVIGQHAVIGGVGMPDAASHGRVATIGKETDTLLPANPSQLGDIYVRLSVNDQTLDSLYYPQLDDADRPLPEGHSFALSAGDPYLLWSSQTGTWCVSTQAAPGFADLSGSPGSANTEVCPWVAP